MYFEKYFEVTCIDRDDRVAITVPSQYLIGTLEPFTAPLPPLTHGIADHIFSYTTRDISRSFPMVHVFLGVSIYLYRDVRMIKLWLWQLLIQCRLGWSTGVDRFSKTQRHILVSLSPFDFLSKGSNLWFPRYFWALPSSSALLFLFCWLALDFQRN